MGISVYRAKVREEVSGYHAKRGRRFQVRAHVKKIVICDISTWSLRPTNERHLGMFGL